MKGKYFLGLNVEQPSGLFFVGKECSYYRRIDVRLIILVLYISFFKSWLSSSTVECFSQLVVGSIALPEEEIGEDVQSSSRNFSF